MSGFREELLAECGRSFGSALTGIGRSACEASVHLAKVLTVARTLDGSRPQRLAATVRWITLSGPRLVHSSAAQRGRMQAIDPAWIST